MPSTRRKPAKTRIIATIGPACEHPDTLKQLMVAGVDVFRLNFAHGDHAWLSGVLNQIRGISEELQMPVGVLGDLSGPKIRLGEINNDEVLCEPGAVFRFVRGTSSSAVNELTCTYDKLIDDVAAGDRILLADGTVSLIVTEKSPAGDAVECVVSDPGLLRSRQGLNLPGVRLSTPAITEKDVVDLEWALANRLDFVGLSFVRSAADISALRQRIESAQPAVSPLIVAKIEKTEALDDLTNILEVTDAVMVARGDLGVEAEISRVPILQKQIIRACNFARIPVITATQMLDSMQSNDRPTRAEVSDVANAVIDGTDAVMLSGETAIGKHPVSCVKMMERIIQEAEPFVVRTGLKACGSRESRRANPVTEAITHGATAVATELEADLIVIATDTGKTALALSRHRGSVPVLAVTHRAETARRICLYWGVTPVHTNLVRQSADALLAHVVEWGRQRDLLRTGSRIIVVGHTNWVGAGHDLLMVHVVP